MTVALKNTTIFVLLLFMVYGLFCPHLPVVNADELWETSRGYYMKTMHKPGEPLLPASVSPFYSSIGNMGWKSWCILSVKTGTFAAMMSLLPTDELSAMRYGMFLWSLLACLFTYLVARKLNLNKWYSLLCVAFLVALPDFFAQIHRERSEIMICASLMISVYFFLRIAQVEDQSRKSWQYFLLGILVWIPAQLIHPSAIIIPAVIGVLYLYYETEKIFSLQTILIGIGLMSGAAFFLFIMNEMKEYAIAAGGGNYFQYQGPPILTKGWKYIISIPYAFYNKFFVANFLTRPVSFIIYAIGLFMIALQTLNKQKFILVKKEFILIAVSSIVSLILLYLLSGSFGNFNVVIAPFIMIFFVKYIEKNSKVAVPAYRFSLFTVILLLTVFSVNALSLGQDVKMSREYSRLTTRIKSEIPKDASILGLALYYNPFKDQPYYSNSWFNPYAGRREQSFEQAVQVLNAKYIILDDAFVARALLDRGRPWTDSMFTFLSQKGKVIDEFDANYFVGNRVPGPEFFPEEWRFDGQMKKYIRKVKVYHIE